MGVAIADALAVEGARVDLILGPSHQRPQEQGVTVYPVHTACQMHEQALALFPAADGAVMSAAVSDYRPANPADQKMKRKAGEDIILSLTPNPDIAAALGQMKKPRQLLVGFALETQNEEDNAQKKLQKKNLDFIVLNSLQDKGAGFGGDTNRVRIIDNAGNNKSFTLKSKSKVAEDIVDKICLMLDEKQEC